MLLTLLFAASLAGSISNLDAETDWNGAIFGAEPAARLTGVQHQPGGRILRYDPTEKRARGVPVSVRYEYEDDLLSMVIVEVPLEHAEAYERSLVEAYGQPTGVAAGTKYWVGDIVTLTTNPDSTLSVFSHVPTLKARKQNGTIQPNASE